MTYDFAILGAGAAGLSLALAMVDSPLKNRSILIVEKDNKNTNDRTWCFWTDKPTTLDGIIHHTWSRLRFQSDGEDRTFDLSPFSYRMIRGLDFYNYARRKLAENKVTIVRGNGEVSDGEQFATVNVDGLESHASWVFDSRIRAGDIIPNPSRFNYIKQHFKGWEIKSLQAIFDPQTATIFDLRTFQQDGLTFFYVLPFSETHALVEFTLFSPDILPEGEYDTAIRGYLAETLGVGSYQILAEEQGIIPMTDQHFHRRLGEHILAIGTRGGRVKPSTGYAFSRIQRDSHAIVRSLLESGHPFNLPLDSSRHRFYDALMLEVLAHQSDYAKPVINDLFARNPIQRILRFLDDQTNIGEELLLISNLTPFPFLRAIRGRFLKR